MIKELFLMASLAPAPMAFAYEPYTSGTLAANQAVIHSAEFIQRRNIVTNPKVLMVGGEPSLVQIFRDHGVAAFGALTDDIPGSTVWHGVMNAEFLAFQSRIFHMVFWLQSNPVHDTQFDSIKEAVRMVIPKGFLLYDDDQYEDWGALLRNWGWERLPFTWGLAIWQRPENNGIAHKDKSWPYRASQSQLRKLRLVKPILTAA